MKKILINKHFEVIEKIKSDIALSKYNLTVSGLVSIIEFSEGVLFGKFIDNLNNNITNFIPKFDDINNNISLNIYREIFIIYIQLFITGCFVLTIRNINRVIGITTLKRSALKDFPPPIALSFGIWYYQDNLKKRIDYVFKNHKYNFLLSIIFLAILIFGSQYFL